MDIPKENLLYKTIDGERKLCISYSQLTTFMDCPRKWYYTYVLGRRSQTKSEATSYGTCIHQTMEYFFKTGRSLTRQQLCDTFGYYVAKEEIPFVSLNSEAKAYIDGMKAIRWISDIYEKDEQGVFIKPQELLSKTEYILRMSDVAGVEEDFTLNYRLPEPITINGKIETHVCIIGSLDLHLEKNGYHTIIDWKSDGKGYYDESKLKTNLQHPIYSMYLYRKYGTLPGSCLYIHTRSQISEELKVDMVRIKEASSAINSVLSMMYSFASSYAEKCKELNPDFDEMEIVKKANPTALCFWCDFSKTSGDSTCEFSSSYTKKSEVMTKDDIAKGQEEVLEMRRIVEEKKKEELIKERQEAESKQKDGGASVSQTNMNYNIL